MLAAGWPARLVRLLYFMAPAYAANMAPPFVRYWKGWNRPISERRLGSHKTVVGFAVGVLAAVLVTFLQSRLAWNGALGLALPLGFLLGLLKIGPAPPLEAVVAAAAHVITMASIVLRDGAGFDEKDVRGAGRPLAWRGVDRARPPYEDSAR